MIFPTYSQMRSWRDICEFLEQADYKFAEPETIRKKCLKALPALYQPEIREHRQRLFEDYLIQFITWQQHPYLSFSRSRRIYRELKDCWGWRLTNGWEAKIDYLERLVLFGQEPSTKTWEPALRQRIIQRQERQQRIELECKMSQMPWKERIKYAADLGICVRCKHPILPLMIDCVECGYRQPDLGD